jgi:hypothetical protein
MACSRFMGLGVIIIDPKWLHHTLFWKPLSQYLSTMGRRPNFMDIDFAEETLERTLTANRGIYFSADGLHHQEELLNVAHKKCCVQASQLVDAYGEWIPLPEDGYQEDEDSGPNPIDSVVSVPGTKHKVYASLVHGQFLCFFQFLFSGFSG